MNDTYLMILCSLENVGTVTIDNILYLGFELAPYRLFLRCPPMANAASEAIVFLLDELISPCYLLFSMEKGVGAGLNLVAAEEGHSESHVYPHLLL